MPMYRSLPGLDITINDRGIQLPIDPTTTESILIIAPIGTAVAYGGTGDIVAPIKVTSQADFGTTVLGQFAATNEAAKLWKQAYDAGCRDLYIAPLKGTTAVEKYEYLHDLYTVLEDQMRQDIILLGGVAADEALSSDPILLRYGTREDFAALIEVINERTTEVEDETLTGNVNGTNKVFTLANTMVTNLIMTSTALGADAVFVTGAFTPVNADGSATLIFAGVTATLTYASAGGETTAGSATAGSGQIAQPASSAEIAAGFKAIFEAVALVPGALIASFDFDSDADGLEITIPRAIAESYNTAEITGTALFATKGDQVTQLSVRGVADVTTPVETTEYDLNNFAGSVIFKTAPVVNTEINAVSYEYYNTNFASQLAGFCTTVSSKNRQLLGVMTLTAPTSTTDLTVIKSYIDGYLTGDAMLYSKYLQIVGGAPLIFSIGNTIYSGMWHGAYAGLISLLPAFSSPTHKVIPGALGSEYTLSAAQLLGLLNQHIVCPRLQNGRLIIGDAITTADDDSDFIRLTTVRIVSDVIALVHETAEPYIGEQNTLAKRNALETQLRNKLSRLISLGALNDFRFNIKSSLKNQIDGDMFIYLDIVPVFEVRRIYIAVSLKAALS
jgi:hypothetical protein